MEMIENWYKKRGNKIVKVILIVLAIYLTFKYLLTYILPFIVAWVIASLLQKIVKLLNNRFKINRTIGTALSMVTVLSFIIWAIVAGFTKLFKAINSLYQSIPLYKDQFIEIFNNVGNQMQNIFSSLPFNLTESLESFTNDIFGKLTGFLGGFLSKGSINIVSKLPNILFFMVITMLAIYFMTRDYDEIKRFAIAQIPDNIVEKSNLLKDDLVGALWGYVRTQLILMSITAVLCLIGFFVLGVDNPFAIALGIGVFDALPVFGSGGILIPWSLYNVIMGEYTISIGLISIYLLVVVVRQVVEPRILSSQIGVNTLVTLVAMYIGFRVVGVFGLIIGPVTVIMIKTLQKAGILPNFKDPDKESQSST